jgi:hypothetical protein
MPDVDRRALDRLARRCVEDGERERERGTGTALGDVPADLLAGT